MSTNTNLRKANVVKNDEFYTRFTDISKELINYKNYFKDKVILCNCDNPNYSAFWKYFHLNFSELGLKKLVSTYYDKDKPVYKMEYRGGNDNDVKDGLKIPLKSNGDFVAVSFTFVCTFAKALIGVVEKCSHIGVYVKAIRGG